MARDKQTGLTDKQSALYFDGDYVFTELDVRNVMSLDFKSEKELCDYIEDHINLFCIVVLSDIYISHKREYQISEYSKCRKNKRLDFYIECEKYRYVIEVKNPIYKSELQAGVGQVLSYIVLLENKSMKVDKYIIVTTKYDELVAISIEKFKLPIDLVIFSKSKYLRYVRSA